MVRISIKKRDAGDVIPLSARDVRLETAGGVSLAAGRGSLRVSCEKDPARRRDYYRQNFKAVTEFSDIPAPGTDTTFEFGAGTGGLPDGYYLGRLAGAVPLHTALAITGGPTFRWNPRPNGIAIDDIGRPDVDCGDYLRAAEYIRILGSKLDDIKDQIQGVPTAGNYGLHKQYQTLLRLWNFMVYRMSVILETSFQSDAVFIQGRYINTTDEPVVLRPCEVTFTLDQGSPAGINGRMSTRIRSTSTKGQAPLWKWTAAQGLSLQPIVAGSTALWTVTTGDPPLTYAVAPRQEAAFTLRLDLSKAGGLPDAHATVGIAWPLDAQETMIVEKERSVFIYHEDIT